MPCDGALVRCHLLPRMVLKKEFPYGVIEGVDGSWRPSPNRSSAFVEGLSYRSLRSLIKDPASWVWGCGGPTGLGGHHGQFDTLRLAVLRERVPEALEVFAAELGIAWWLDRRFGRRFEMMGRVPGERGAAC